VLARKHRSGAKRVDELADPSDGDGARAGLPRFAERGVGEEVCESRLRFLAGVIACAGAVLGLAPKDPLLLGVALSDDELCTEVSDFCRAEVGDLVGGAEVKREGRGLAFRGSSVALCSAHVLKKGGEFGARDFVLSRSRTETRSRKAELHDSMMASLLRSSDANGSGGGT
jgi:hypothetical protein